MEQLQPLPMAKKHHSFDVTELSSQMSYFLIYSYSHDLKQKPQVEHMRPFMVTFRQDYITFVQIMDRYLKLNPSEKRPNKMLVFTLPIGSIINRNMTVKNLKKQLRRDSVEGINLFVRNTPEQKQKNRESTSFDNECGIMDFVNEHYFERDNMFIFHFLLPHSPYTITLNISPNEKVSKLFDEFVKHLSQNYRQTINATKFEKITKTQIRDYVLADNSNFSKFKEKEKTIHECALFNNGDIINVIMQKPNFTFAKIIKNDFQIKLISKGDNRTLKNKIMTIKYDQIADFTVSNLYKVYFLDPAQRKTFDIETKENKICLKVLEYIIKPDQLLGSIDKAIQKVKTLGSFKLVAYFVTEKMIFYQQMKKINANYEFSLDHLNLAQHNKNKSIIKQCESNSQKFVTQRIKALQQLTAQKYFKTPKQALPIVVYSSQLEIKTEESDPNQTVFYSLNKWLRTNSILQPKQGDLGHWCYKFASILYKHLSMIKNGKKNLYRGVTYHLQAKENDKVTFKNFLSTTFDINVATQFAVAGQQEKHARNPQSPLAPLVLYNITASEGKSIQHFSVYPQQKEYLFEPYSQFKLIRKKEEVHVIHSSATMKKQKFTFTVYDLQEIPTPKLMPQTINNYIIWVDDKPYEGQIIFNQLISEFLYPTVLFQILSTKDLVTWIQERSMIINDPTKKMIMITNMVRKEDGKPNYYAGVDAINIVNTSIVPNIPIAVYVGNMDSANNNLKQKGCNSTNYKVMNTFEDLSKYVSQKIGVSFKRSSQNDLQQVQPDNINNGNNGVEGSICQIW